MKRVAMFVTNPCTHDARVMKEAGSLVVAGYDVRVFALATAHSPEGVFEQGGYIVHRLKFESIFARTKKAVWKFSSYLSYPFVVLAKIIFRLSLLAGALVLAAIALCVLPFMPERARSYMRSAKLKLSDSLSRSKQGAQTGEIDARRAENVLIRLYLKVRLWTITGVNRVVVALLLPAHKISTYYYFCQLSAKHAIEWRADIAHAHDLNTMYAAKLVKDSIGAKIVYDSHELWIHRNRVGRKASIEKLLDRVVERYLIAYADAVVTVCDSIGEWLKERYPNIPQPIIVRNMPHKMNEADQGSDVEPLNQRLNIPEGHASMIYTGKITSGRGIEIGVDALAEVDELHFVILGYGESGYVDGLKQKIDSLGVSERIIFCDPVPHDEVTSFIYGADFALVYIEPICLSYEYALPNKLFESIQAGIPIMGSSLVEVEKVVLRYDVGLCFSDASDLANKIRMECNKLQLDKWRRSIKNAAFDLCWDKEQVRLIELYAKL